MAKRSNTTSIPYAAKKKTFWQLLWKQKALCIMALAPLIMNLGNVLNSDYTKILLMQNDTNRSQLEVIGTFVYQKGIVEGKFSYATAVNLFISVIGFALVFGANMITRKINPENSLW